ncbi:MAG: hypothetical protein K2M37_06510 [Muribaculaceae bacterium]|nr:hypothetical protein [Muribaculaceae bacterium]
MIQYQAMTKRGFSWAIIVAIMMSAAAFLTGSGLPMTGESGICLPSANLWLTSELASWLVNLGLIIITGVSAYFLNKDYSFIPGSNYLVLPGMYVLITASNPWISAGLTSSALLAIANIVCLAIMFSCYRQRNATQEMFAVATILSLGTMTEYGFILYIPAYIAIAIILKCFGLKELGAYLLGLFAPYWVGVGLGILPLDSFRLPTITNLLTDYTTASDLLTGLIMIAATGLITLVTGLNNSVKLYAGNTHRRLLNASLNVIGLVTILAMVFDTGNLLFYVSTLNLLMAVQLANVFALWSRRRGSIWILALSAAYIGAGIAMMKI